MRTSRTVLAAGAVAAMGAAFAAGFMVRAQLGAGQSGQASQAVIRVLPETLAAQAANRAAMIGRELTGEEIADIAERQVQIEVLIREAAKLDVHLKDADIRKHMVAVMGNVLGTRVPEPTDAELDAYYDQHRDRYQTLERVSFEHFFFPDDEQAATALAAKLEQGAAVPQEAGEIFWLGRRMERYSSGQLLTVLGHGFVTELKSASVGEWFGPVKSGRGWHVVRLEERHLPEPLPPAEREQRLRRDWKEEQSAAGYDRQIEDMRSAYDVQLPDPDEVSAAIVALQLQDQAVVAHNAPLPDPNR